MKKEEEEEKNPKITPSEFEMLNNSRMPQSIGLKFLDNIYGYKNYISWKFQEDWKIIGRVLQILLGRESALTMSIHIVFYALPR